MKKLELKSYQFRREREQTWAEFERMLEFAELRGLGALSSQDLVKLPTLHRHAVSSLSVARAISLDTNLIRYLDGLALRGHVVVYGIHHGAPKLGELLMYGFPEAVRGASTLLALAFGCYLSGALCGAALVSQEESWGVAILRIPDAFDMLGFTTRTQLFAFTPETGEQTRELRDALRLVSSMTFSCNVTLALLCYTSGFLLGVPTAVLLFANGLTCGAVFAYHAARGQVSFFVNHFVAGGMVAILAFCLSGAAGLMLGRGLGFPGRRSRRESLTAAGRESAALLPGIAVLFLLSTLLSLTATYWFESTPGRAAIGTSALAMIGLYLIFARRRVIT